MGPDGGAKKGDTYKEYMSPVLARPYEIGAERGHVPLLEMRYMSPFLSGRKRSPLRGDMS